MIFVDFLLVNCVVLVKMEWNFALIAISVALFNGFYDVEGKSKPGRGRGSMWW